MHPKPVARACGAVMTAVMVALGCVLILAFANALRLLIEGQASMPLPALIACAFILGWIIWYLNFFEVFRQLKRLDPDSYELGTGGVGFLARLWSSRGSLYSMNQFLGTLDLSLYPPNFARRVRVARASTAVLLVAFVMLVVGSLVAAIVLRWTRRG